MMDRRQERVTLERIVALLLALADLADRARDRSPAVRAVVLWLLRPAEAVACDFVFAAPSPAGLAGAAEAARLALSFRALASALRREARSGFSPNVSGGAHRALAFTLGLNLGLAPRLEKSAPHDTS